MSLLNDKQKRSFRDTFEKAAVGDAVYLGQKKSYDGGKVVPMPVGANNELVRQVAQMYHVVTTTDREVKAVDGAEHSFHRFLRNLQENDKLSELERLASDHNIVFGIFVFEPVFAKKNKVSAMIGDLEGPKSGSLKVYINSADDNDESDIFEICKSTGTSRCAGAKSLDAVYKKIAAQYPSVVLL